MEMNVLRELALSPAGGGVDNRECRDVWSCSGKGRIYATELAASQCQESAEI